MLVRDKDSPYHCASSKQPAIVSVICLIGVGLRLTIGSAIHQQRGHDETRTTRTIPTRAAGRRYSWAASHSVGLRKLPHRLHLIRPIASIAVSRDSQFVQNQP